ncbi:prepilin-type N-terminal cleavage/methylation domain-containing protein [Tahibacter amnicola]|uniref:Prepilin-type N-terminal cleavage/methylation domain-containing protein n=1 Tax=Tahibacter amnicola TaxID=2976241 RepID=A0ABY6BDA2_9GAMM|nr:prepilin-type N-terminal cleavage/methylation domain-containing protein [Tahibacter amnicola]UXI67787.1 prepilin-type N-terminal cleavage/methylation domain-containing protein [Tahibacter amnicola]
MSRPGRSQGFSLLEVLLALTLLAILMAGAMSGIRAATKAMHSGEAVIDRNNRLRVAQEFIRRELSRALPLAFGQENGTGTNFVFQGEKDFIRFVAPMPGHLSRGGPYVQSLELARGRKGLQLLFTHQMLNGFDLEKLSTKDVEPVLLLDGIRRGSIQFRKFDDQGELEDWTDEWENPSMLPVMVRIDLEMTPESGLVWPTMDIPLLLDTSGGIRLFQQRNGQGQPVAAPEPGEATR